MPLELQLNRREMTQRQESGGRKVAGGKWREESYGRKFGDVQIKAMPVYTDEDRERILGKGLSDDFKRYYANLSEELKPAAVVGLAQTLTLIQRADLQRERELLLF